MFKIFRAYATFLLLAVIAIKELVQTTTGRAMVSNAVLDWTTANPTHPATSFLSTVVWTDELDTPAQELDRVLDNVLVGCESIPGSSKGDYELISKVVDFLGLPYTTNRVSNQTMTALRSAILRPSEIAAFVKASKDALSCATCSKKLSPDEILSLRSTKDGGYVIYCTACAIPRFSRCIACGEPAPLSTAALSIVSSSKFITCACGGKGIKAKPDLSSIKKHIYTTRNRGAGIPISVPAPPGSSQAQSTQAWAQSILGSSDPFGDGGI